MHRLISMYAAINRVQEFQYMQVGSYIVRGFGWDSDKKISGENFERSLGHFDSVGNMVNRSIPILQTLQRTNWFGEPPVPCDEFINECVNA